MIFHEIHSNNYRVSLEGDRRSIHVLLCKMQEIGSMWESGKATKTGQVTG